MHLVWQILDQPTPSNSAVRSSMALNHECNPPQCNMTITNEQANRWKECYTSESLSPVKALIRGEVRIEMLLSSGVIGIAIDSTPDFPGSFPPPRFRLNTSVAC